MANYRSIRINDATAEALSVILREVKDPRITDNFVSITGAEVSHDLKYAKIFWSSLNADAEEEKNISKGLKSASGFLRKRLSEELNLRQTPELMFAVDHSARNGAHIASLLNSIEKKDNES